MYMAGELTVFSIVYGFDVFGLPFLPSCCSPSPFLPFPPLLVHPSSIASAKPFSFPFSLTPFLSRFLLLPLPFLSLPFFDPPLSLFLSPAYLESLFLVFFLSFFRDLCGCRSPSLCPCLPPSLMTQA